MKKQIVTLVFAAALFAVLCACGVQEQMQAQEAALEALQTKTEPAAPVYDIYELESHYRDCGMMFDVFQVDGNTVILTKKTEVPCVAREDIAANSSVYYDAQNAFRASKLSAEKAYNLSGGNPPEKVVYQCAFSNWDLMSAVSYDGFSVATVSYVYDGVKIEHTPASPSQGQSAGSSGSSSGSTGETLTAWDLYQDATGAETQEDSHYTTVLLSDSDAFYLATKIVKDELKAPSTAKFCKLADAEIKRDDQTGDYAVCGWVDAQNSFGAVLREVFLVTFTPLKDGDQIGYRNPTCLLSE